MADCVTHVVGSITRFFSKRTTDDRISDASSSGINPRAVLPPRATYDRYQFPKHSSAGQGSSASEGRLYM
eukprot:1221119-Heterocapsa_arctica.AAC.1